MHPCLHRLSLLLPCVLLAGPVAHAQTVEGAIRNEYAEVLRVEPVYLPVPPPDESVQCAPMLVLEPATATRANAANAECIPLESAQPQSGPQVLYDVDYVLHGVKYRSRLPYDPGNRVQVRISVTPLVPPGSQP